MDEIIAIVLILGLGIVAGALLGWLAFFRVNELRRDVDRLSNELKHFKQNAANSPAVSPSASSHSPSSPSVERGEVPAPIVRDNASSTAEGVSLKHTYPRQNTQTVVQPEPRPGWLDHLIENWMIWLGGVSVALAGIFMVKYSINMGMLGPKTQITLAIMTGVVLHVAADWFRRHNGGSDPVFASLAGGASITLYAALLAALHIYHFIDPRWAFAGLAVVSLMTMALALVHGPMLAMIGLVGAYVVPILVNTNSGNMVSALIYSLIISGAALLLTRYVFRPWLWWSVIVGALGWWLLSLTTHQPDDFRGVYLAILAWAILAVPGFDWLLRVKVAGFHAQADEPMVSLAERVFSPNQVAMGLIVAAWGASILWQGQSAIDFMLWAPLVVVMCFAANGRKNLWGFPWLSLVVQWLAWLFVSYDYPYSLNHFQLQALAEHSQNGFLILTALMALLYSGLTGWFWRTDGFSHPRVSLVLLAPLAWLALAYLRINGISQSLEWSVSTLLIGVIYASIAALRLQRNQTDQVSLWLILAAHLSYSLAVTLYFREASLSLALAAQLVTLSWLIKRYQLPWLSLLVKGVLAIVVIRLTINPWLAGYPVDIHWTFWTYGGATLFAWYASRQISTENNLRSWLEAASLHLLVLTLGAELRYWLYDGDVYIHRYNLTEAAINTSLWVALSLTYQFRASVSENLSRLYYICSKILLVMALASYIVLVSIHNPLWSGDIISATPLWNILVLAYGAPIIWVLLIAKYHDPQLRSLALRCSGFVIMLFVILEIRQLWQGGDISIYRTTSDGELYTYSVVWMLMAIPAILLGTRWSIKDLYKAGMGLLAVVIAKIFLIDMSGLDGLWRVAAFMGLGLSLLGLAWLYRRMQSEKAD